MYTCRSSLFALLATLAALPSFAHAGTAADRMAQRIDNRQARQEQRIDQGVASGALTARETARLERQQAHVDRVEDRALADDTLNRREAVRMERLQDRTSRHVAVQKHDRQVSR